MHRRLRLLAFPLALVLVCLSVLWAAAARRDDSAPRDEPRPHPERDAPALWPTPAGAPAAAAAPLSATAQEVIPPEELSDRPWKWMAFVTQSARESDDWEIYLDNGATDTVTRLTSNPSADIEPNLAPGGQWVAFASDRDGDDLELYVMDAAGGHVRRLTDNDVDDARPIWSPDGQRIAYQTYQWGRADVMVMNADGSHVQRLTDDPGYDGDPTWSPDGTQIAFCSSRQDNEAAIFVMPAGGGAARRLSSLADSCDPIWSPDGQSIAFDTSAGPGMFYDLALMNPDGSNERIFHSVEGQVSLMPGSWTPGGRYVVYAVLYYSAYQGQFYLSAADVEIRHIHPGLYAARLTQTHRDLYPATASLDVTPPTANLWRLPEFSRTLGYALIWSGYESPGGSGLTWFDLETRPGPTAPWSPLLTKTTATTYMGMAPAGRIEFRLRAHDAALNVTPWPAGNSTATLLFAAALSGRVTDNRGVQMPVAPTVAPQAVTRQATDDGYLLRLGTLGEHTLTLSRDGYGWLPATTRAIGADSRHDFYLPPPGNLLANGHFEATAALDGWTVGGTLPVAATTEQVNAGRRAVVLGAACASPCLAERGPAPAALGPVHLVADSRGGLHVTSSQDSASFYRYRPAGGVWSAAVAMPDGGPVLALAIDAEDTLHVIQANNGRTCYRRRPWQGSWSSCESPGIAVADAARLAVGSDGVVYLDSGAALVRRAAGGWQPVAALPGQSWQPPFQASAVDANGIFYAATTLPIDSDHDKTVIRPLLNDRMWGPEFRVPDERPVIEMFFDKAGNLHLWAMGDDNAVLYGYRRASDGWFSGFSHFADSAWAGARILGVDQDSRGVLHVLYVSLAPVYGVTYRSKLPDGWSAPRPVSASGLYSAYSALAVGADDALHVLAPQPDDAPAYLAEFGPPAAAQAGAATLSQAVTIPAAMPHPTLAWMQRVLGNAGGGATVAVRVQAGNNAPQSFPLHGDSRWALSWLDLSPWRGQRVTITFAVEQPADQPTARLWLDSITLGPASPQLWLTFDAPRQAQPGATMAATLAVGNHGAVEATATTLTLTLPDGLTLAAATPPAQVSGRTVTWSLGALAPGGEQAIALTLAGGSGLRRGETVTLAAEVSSDPPDVERGDNRRQQEVFIGWQTFLPGLLR